MLITISGVPGSGKTTVARLVARALDLEHVYAGDIFRRQAEAAGLTLPEYLRRAERNMAVFPGRRLEDWRDYWQWIAAYKDPADLEHLLDGLRKAGLED